MIVRLNMRTSMHLYRFLYLRVCKYACMYMKVLRIQHRVCVCICIYVCKCKCIIVPQNVFLYIVCQYLVCLLFVSSGRLGQLSHCRQLIAHIGYGRFSKGEITMDNNKCNICADKVVVPLSMHHGGDAVCLYVLSNSKVESALLSEAVKVFSEMVSSFSEMPFRSTTTTTTDAYPIAYPIIVRTRAVILLHTMLTFFQRETVCDGDSEDDSGDDSVRHHVGARAREKSYYQLVFADQRIAQVLALIGKYIWYCEKVTPKPV